MAFPRSETAAFRECRTVEDLRDAALAQAKQAISADKQLRGCGKAVSACAVVHWTLSDDDLGGAHWEADNTILVCDVETVIDGRQNKTPTTRHRIRPRKAGRHG